MIKIKNVLISQPAPADYEKSPYKHLADKYNLKLVFKKFIKIEAVTAKDFRQERINFLDYTAVVFTSRNAVDYYFKMAKEMRLTIPPTMKYFCSSETTAFYMQNYIQYRKRKIFYANQTNLSLVELMTKHKDEKFLMPCSDQGNAELSKLLEKVKIRCTKACLYNTVPDSAINKEINIDEYDLLVFFSPVGIKSLMQNFPKFKQKEKLIGAFGPSVCMAVEDAGFQCNIPAPTATAPSMVQAIDEYLAVYNKGTLPKPKNNIKTDIQKAVKEDEKALENLLRKEEELAIQKISIKIDKISKTRSVAVSNAAADKAAALDVIARKKASKK